MHYSIIEYYPKRWNYISFWSTTKDSDLKIDFNLIYSKELKIIPSYAASEKEIHQTITLLTNNIIDFEPLITHKFPLNNSFDALKYAHKAKDAMKIIITSFRLNLKVL